MDDYDTGHYENYAKKEKVYKTFHKFFGCLTIFGTCAVGIYVGVIHHKEKAQSCATKENMHIYEIFPKFGKYKQHFYITPSNVIQAVSDDGKKVIIDLNHQTKFSDIDFEFKEATHHEYVEPNFSARVAFLPRGTVVHTITRNNIAQVISTKGRPSRFVRICQNIGKFRLLAGVILVAAMIDQNLKGQKEDAHMLYNCYEENRRNGRGPNYVYSAY